jgi:hypothetical protein
MCGFFGYAKKICDKQEARFKESLRWFLALEQAFENKFSTPMFIRQHLLILSATKSS